MKAIFKRELKSYFYSLIGCLFIGAVLFITGIYVTVYNLLSGLPNISYSLSGVIFIFIISIPILTMRVLAEERRQKTDQMILTAPVSVGQIVAGKFFALAAVFTIPILIISFYPLVLSLFGTVPLIECYVAIAAFYLYGLTCIAIGIFVSSLTESQVIAAVLSFALLFIGYVMNGICSMISQTGNWLTRILSSFDLVSRFDTLISGTFDIKSVVYFVSVILLVLFLTVQSIQKRRYNVSVRKMRIGAYSFTMTMIAAALAVIVNLLAAEIPIAYTVFDVTAQKLYSLTDETKKLAGGLTEDITIYVLSGKDSQDTTLEKTLQQYDALSEHINVSYVDPIVNPKFYTKYSDSPLSGNSLIVESEKRSKAIEYSTVYETTVDYNTYSTNVTGYDGEGQITSALNYVISDNMPKMYMVEGHGELALETDFNNTIAKANIEYESIQLLQHETIPEDAECIVINAPTSDFSAEDTAKVLDYLKKGGNALIVSTWTEEKLPNFESILAFYEVSVADGMVLEGNPNSYYQSPFYILPTIEADQTTESIGEALIFAPYAQGLIVPETTSEEITLIPLLSSSSDSYAKSSINETDDYDKQENDQAGPFSLGVKAIKSNANQESIAFIYSSESLFTDSANQMVSGANMRLFSATLSSLAEETEGIAVPVKSYQMNYLTIPQINIILMALAITVIIPLTFIISGLIVWLKRRKA